MAKSGTELDPIISLDLTVTEWQKLFGISRMASFPKGLDEAHPETFHNLIRKLETAFKRWQKLQELMGQQGLRSFPPLPDDHPAIGLDCSLCEQVFKEGDRLALMPVRPYNQEAAKRKEAGERHAAACELVHHDCFKRALTESTV